MPLATKATVAVVPPLLSAVPPPLMERFTLPVGEAVPLAATTVMVKVSFSFNAGDELDAVIVVVVPIREAELPVLAGQAVIRLARFTDPNPVTSS